VFPGDFRISCAPLLRNSGYSLIEHFNY